MMNLPFGEISAKLARPFVVIDALLPDRIRRSVFSD